MCVCMQVGRQVLVQECVETQFYIPILSVRQKSQHGRKVMGEGIRDLQGEQGRCE